MIEQELINKTLTIEAETIPLFVDADNVVRVSGTRITLDTLVIAFNEGATAEEIVKQYPSLHLADVYAVIGYYLRRRSEVTDYIKNRRRQMDETRQLNISRFDPVGIRERLLARKT